MTTSQLSFRAADPFSTASVKALEAIGKNLQAQYERWQPRVSSIVSFRSLDLAILGHVKSELLFLTRHQVTSSEELCLLIFQSFCILM